MPNNATEQRLLKSAEVRCFWISTKEMAEALGIHRLTLQRLKRSGFLKEKQHFIKANPTSPRSNLLWNYNRTMMKMGRI